MDSKLYILFAQICGDKNYKRLLFNNHLAVHTTIHINIKNFIF